MKKLACILSAYLITAASFAHGASDSFVDYAEVVSVNPITRTVHIPDQRKECWDEIVTKPAKEDEGGSFFGTLLGGVAGGLLGHQVGGGSGKTAATIGGTIAGAAVGNKIAKGNRDNEPEQNYQRRCRVIDKGYNQDRIEGYNVKYKYEGKTYNIRTNYDPGEKIKIRVRTIIEPIVN